MTRRTYTPGDVATLALSGSLPGLLAPSWRGPVLAWRSPARWVPATIVSDDGDEREVVDEVQYGEHVALADLRLPLARPEARFRVACWLWEGERCKEHKREWGDCVPEDHAYPRGRQLVCVRCNESGYLRPPAPLWWALSPGPSTLPPWVATACLHASALRGAAGMGAVCDVIHRESAQSCVWLNSRGSEVGLRGSSEETMLAADYALLDDDSLTVGVPS